MKKWGYRHPKHNLRYFERILNYDSKTGIFTRVKTGKTCGHKDVIDGYLRLEIDGVSYLLHRIAWLFVHRKWPKRDIDHKDRVRDNNRIINLRDATRSENLANAFARKNSKTQLRGVSWVKKNKKWRAQIRRGNKKFHFDSDCPHEAKRFYDKKAKELFGEFAL